MLYFIAYAMRPLQRQSAPAHGSTAGNPRAGSPQEFVNPLVGRSSASTPKAGTPRVQSLPDSPFAPREFTNPLVGRESQLGRDSTISQTSPQQSAHPSRELSTQTSIAAADVGLLSSLYYAVFGGKPAQTSPKSEAELKIAENKAREKEAQEKEAREREAQKEAAELARQEARQEQTPAENQKYRQNSHQSTRDVQQHNSGISYPVVIGIIVSVIAVVGIITAMVKLNFAGLFDDGDEEQTTTTATESNGRYNQNRQPDKTGSYDSEGELITTYNEKGQLDPNGTFDKYGDDLE